MRRPTPDELRLLNLRERLTFEVADRFNRDPRLKRASHAFLRTAGAAWVHHCTKNILHVQGAEHLTSLDPAGGLVIASNHRSFFDMYVIASVLLRRTDFVREMYFPVRSNYFYEGAGGVVVNAVMAGLAMYPPVLRAPDKRAFNRYTMDALTQVATRRGAVVGYHPEGTRNKTPDPYTLLPANPGIGRLTHGARPTVLPAFILGLSNDFPRQVVGNFTGQADPVTIVFGAPMDLAELYAEPAEQRTYVRIAERIKDRIAELGESERTWRAQAGLPDLAPPAETAPAEPTPAAEARWPRAR